jgi:hypothetical protein
MVEAMAYTVEPARKMFLNNMLSAPSGAVGVIEKIEEHFGAQQNTWAYFRKAFRLSTLRRYPDGKLRERVFATIKWQPQIRTFLIGSYIEPRVWTNLGFENASLTVADTLTSKINILPAGWRDNQNGLLSALEEAKRNMETGV